MKIKKVSSFYQAGPYHAGVSQDYIMPSYLMKSGIFKDSETRKEDIFLVADGMSSNPLASKISEYACERVYSLLKKNSLNDRMSLEIIKNVLNEANGDILKNFATGGGGTTLTGIVLEKEICHLFHVGDSLAFINYYGGNLINITPIEHSNIFEMFLKSEKVYYSQIKNNKNKVLTNFMGNIPEKFTFYYAQHSLKKVRQIVLMTDGAYSPISERELAFILNNEKYPLKKILEFYDKPFDELQNIMINYNRVRSTKAPVTSKEAINMLNDDDKSIIIIEFMRKFINW